MSSRLGNQITLLLLQWWFLLKIEETNSSTEIAKITLTVETDMKLYLNNIVFSSVVPLQKIHQNSCQLIRFLCGTFFFHKLKLRRKF